MQIPANIDRTGKRQLGLVTPRQLTEATLTRQRRRTLAKDGALFSANKGVLRMFGAPPSWHQRLLAACLSAGSEAVASHRAAALLWSLIDPPAPIEITVPYERLPTPDGTIRHRTQALRLVDRALRRQIPVTTPARTLLDLGAVAPRLVPPALERALHQKLLTTAALWKILGDIGGRGRRGAGVLRKVLDDRALGDARPESLLESMFASIAALADVTLVYQHPVTVDGQRYRLDFAVPEIMIDFEIDGLSAHGSDRFDDDLERQNRLQENGWLVIRFSYTQLKKPQNVRNRVLRVIERRCAGLL